MPRALLSVYDKSGLVEFATVLSNAGYDLVASGGTEQALRAAGFAVTPVEQLTGFADMLGGRVKTLHPAIHAGILARDTEQDLDELTHAGYAPINLVVCNLYPFLQTVSKASVSVQDAVEQIDIGGVTLLRAAAKNFFHVTTVCDPADYEIVANVITQASSIDLALRRQLAIKAFAHTRDYDTAIHAYLARELAPELTDDNLPAQLSIAVQQLDMLRYGENPHQSAAYYSRNANEGPLGGTLLAGKALSYNNILDLDAAWRTVSSFDAPTVVIVKHLNPTGIATDETIAKAYPLALESDPVSAFGGVIAVNRPVDEVFVSALGSLFLEAIVAPHFSDSAVSMLTSARKNCRLMLNIHPYDGATLEIRAVHRGLLAQRADLGDPEHTTFKTITRRAPTATEMTALQFAWKAVQHVKSNAIVIAGEHATYGIGGGLPSRVDATKLALEKAGARARGACLASDAFFPFTDGVEAAITAGVTAIIQPGGSIRDNEVIEKANEADIAMVFTGVRHFRH
jgi:phosphoribosylaminoimidazolecarboxamide formyltransferase / IMP cyclohydrolase